MSSGLSNRWFRGNLLATVLVLLAAEALLLLYTVNSTYSSAVQTLRSEITLLSGRYSTVQQLSSRERASLLRTFLQEKALDDSADYTLQLLDEDGLLYASSEGFLPAQQTWMYEELTPQALELAMRSEIPAEQLTQAVFRVPEDFIAAQTTDDRIGENMSTGRQGERVLAVTWLLPSPVRGIRAVRLVTSLAEVNRLIWQVFAISMGVVAGCILLILFTGLYFVRSIVRPLAQVEATATRIAGGNFSMRLKKKHNDEIGRLCDTINNMAEELSKTEKLKNEFISSVSHELRTPLTSIKGWTETLRRIDDVNDPNYAHGMRIISGETDRLYAMVEELLDFSRMQSKGLELHKERLDLAAEVSDAVLTVQQRVLQAKIRLDYDEPEAVMVIDGDADRLKQVFINILDNAIKYSPAGGTIVVSVTAAGGECCVSVKDQGPGIAPDELELVKTRFYKGRGAVRGSGIGLSVADEIIRAHGGTLQLQSALGRGTTVSVRLPQQME